MSFKQMSQREDKVSEFQHWYLTCIMEVFKRHSALLRVFLVSNSDKKHHTQEYLEFRS